MATNDEIKAAVDAIDRKLTEHIADATRQRMDAFPEGDVHGHRKAHEAMIEAKQAEAQFWREMRLDLAKKSAWGLVVLVIGLVTVGGLYSVASKLGVAATSVKP